MQLFIDVLLIAVFALLVFRGWWRGFIKSVLSLGRLLLSLIITIIAGSAFAARLDEAIFNPAVFKVVHAKLSDIAADVAATAEGGVQAFVDQIPASFRTHLDLDAVDPTAKLDSLVESWSESISAGISGVISIVVGYILLFVICFVVLTLVIFIIGKFTKLSAIRKMDKLLGLALGLVSGVVAVMFIAVVLGAILSVFGQGELVDNSFMLRLFSGVRDLLIK